MGPIEKTAQSIINANLPLTLVIITGRNEKLFKRLNPKPGQFRRLSTALLDICQILWVQRIFSLRKPDRVRLAKV